MTFDHPLINKLHDSNFILGSTSPRRQEILSKNFGITNFKIIESKFEENLEKEGKTPLQYVKLTSRGKGDSILTKLHKDSIILTCDTIISCNGLIFEKPGDKTKQKEFFNYFREHKHINVISAMTLIILSNGKVRYFDDYDTTKLVFDPDEALLDAYIDSEEGLEAAGGFKYQETGCLLFKRIEGDYLNVVGLPLKTFQFLNDSINN